MDSIDLLAREEEFRKLNKQLEERSSSLVKEIENVMQKQDIFAEFKHKLSSTPKYHRSKKTGCEIDNSSTTKLNNQCASNNIAQRTTNETKGTNECNVQSDATVAPFLGTVPTAKPDSVSGVELLQTNVKCDCCTTDRVNDDLQFLHAFVTVNIHDKVLPQSYLKGRYSVESVCKFLSSKCQLLQEQIDKLQSVIATKASQCERHLAQYAELECDRMKLLNQCNNYRAEALEYKNRSAILQSKLMESERLYQEQRSETDRLSSEVKRLRSKNASVEGKMSNYVEQIAGMKQQIEAMKGTEKEFRESSRAHSADQKSVIAKQESKIKQLSHTIEKLHRLTENLKRQNEILGTNVALQGLEKEYSKLLMGE